MLKVGITGGIGSGKSLVCEVFRRLGVPIYHADTAAKRLYDTDQQLRSQMIELFGNDLYKTDTVDRKMLASIIFNDKAKMDAVSSLVHPAIGRDFIQWIAQQTNAPYVIQEAAILIESGLAHTVDTVVSISSPEALRIRRACTRDKASPDEVKRRIANQMSDDERNSFAQYIVLNNDTQPLLPQILRLHTIFSTSTKS